MKFFVLVLKVLTLIITHQFLNGASLVFYPNSSGLTNKQSWIRRKWLDAGTQKKARVYYEYTKIH